ncbi:Rne/Rng family ribonuclease [Mesorhizobium xinjiangense]|uniref:Rne/Rng family ribonuclease n=1 Tax=Mesorhizobium xinjiangense TaxID=2678685 RepID=UPI0012ECE264|nr:ribonuclease E/G [Mesorhizobium xinjiangense]
MPNKMLIDASHPEETRVVVTRGNRIEEFDFESQDKKQLKGNIYLARVTRVEPSLQAAFVEYGGNRHGFLAFSEIHPDYYQIPVADRQALLRAEAEDAKGEDDEDDAEAASPRRKRASSRRRSKKDAAPQAQPDDDASNSDDDSPAVTMAAAVAADTVSDNTVSDKDEAANGHEESNDRDDENDDDVESVGAEDALEEVPNRRRSDRKQYKIQEVVKRRQILLVQVVKEERGNKGAALTTYLSLAGRYSVLMPNTARGGGISRKITNAQDRKRLKSVVKDLEVPQGMGVILRTAGANRTKAEVKRDYEYLMRLWENVRTLTLESTAPTLVYEEGSLIKRSVRDLYNKEIDEILVAGEEGYREAKDFMRMLMPSHAKVVQPYRDIVPIFARQGIEAQLDRMLQPQVTLKSGGYIIINQTEALVSIDVNSGRSTKEHSIEDTALQTNLEAAEEVARQLRLRDLAGLIVIDFIDMEEKRNNRAVEKRLKDHLKHDRARIQVGRISHFGLLEMSRQRIRASVLESTMKPCPHCGGSGHIRSDSSIALHVMRAIEEYLLKDARFHISVRTPVATALYVLNNKRANIADLESRFGLTITIEADENVGNQHYVIQKGAPVERPVEITTPPLDGPSEALEEETEPVDASAAPGQENAEGEDGRGRKRKRRRRRRGGRDRDQVEADQQTQSDETVAAEAGDKADEDATADEETVDSSEQKKRRRGKRGGRKNRKGDEGVTAEAADNADAEAPASAEAAVPAPTDEAAAAEAEQPAAETPVSVVEVEAKAEKPKRAPRRRSKKTAADEAAVSEAPQEDVANAAPTEEPTEPDTVPQASDAAATPEGEAVQEPPKKPRRGRKRADAEPVPADPVVTSTAPVEEDAQVAEDESSQPKRSGWWQRKGFF